MEIKYLGQNGFLLKEKNSYLAFGSSGKKIQADVVIIGKDISSKNAENFSPKKREKTFLVIGPGEYEIAGIEVWGGEDHYWLVQIEGWRICFANSGWKIPNDKKIDQFGQIDILLIVLSGKVGEAKEAAEMVKRLSPAITIPAYEREARSGWEKEFLDAMDREDLKAEEKLKLDRKELSEDKKLVLLKENK